MASKTSSGLASDPKSLKDYGKTWNELSESQKDRVREGKPPEALSPGNKVKVDKAISTGIDFNLTHQRFIKWLIAGCHAIDVQVCAEGIETESELMVYKRFQVDYGQGYLWSPAIDFNDFEKLANPMSTAEFSLGQLIK